MGEARLRVKLEHAASNRTGRAAEAIASIIWGFSLTQLHMGLATPRAVRIKEFRRASTWQSNKGFSGGLQDFVLDAYC
jgi:hypothetical protein